MNKQEHTKNLIVLKTEEGYLADVWEEYGDDDGENYSFTDNPLQALTFFSENDVAPKYLWDKENKQSLETVMDACRYLKGKLALIEVKTTVEWREIQTREVSE